MLSTFSTKPLETSFGHLLISGKRQWNFGNDPQRDIYIFMEGPVLTAYHQVHLKRETIFCLQKVASSQF